MVEGFSPTGMIFIFGVNVPLVELVIGASIIAAGLIFVLIYLAVKHTRSTAVLQSVIAKEHEHGRHLERGIKYHVKEVEKLQSMLAEEHRHHQERSKEMEKLFAEEHIRHRAAERARTGLGEKLAAELEAAERAVEKLERPIERAAGAVEREAEVVGREIAKEARHIFSRSRPYEEHAKEVFKGVGKKKK